MNLFTLFSVILTLSSLLAAEVAFEHNGVLVKTGMKGPVPQYGLVKREIPAECRKVIMSNETVWTGSYAHPKVPKACKSTYMHTTGKLQPIKLHDDVETYGELETLAFIKEMQTNPKLLLVDARKESWYTYMTIPGAVNLPFHHFRDRHMYEFDFDDAMEMLGVAVTDEGHYDFSNAKTILIFCNGPWCGQSSMMIQTLVDLYYPEEKIKWYRGGLQSWLGAGMTVDKKKE